MPEMDKVMKSLSCWDATAISPKSPRHSGTLRIRTCPNHNILFSQRKLQAPPFHHLLIYLTMPPSYACFICGVDIQRGGYDGLWLQQFRIRKLLCIAASPMPTSPLILDIYSLLPLLRPRVYSLLRRGVYNSPRRVCRQNLWCRHQPRLLAGTVGRAHALG